MKLISRQVVTQVILSIDGASVTVLRDEQDQIILKVQKIGYPPESVLISRRELQDWVHQLSMLENSDGQEIEHYSHADAQESE